MKCSRKGQDGWAPWQLLSSFSRILGFLKNYVSSNFARVIRQTPEVKLQRQHARVHPQTGKLS